MADVSDSDFEKLQRRYGGNFIAVYQERVVAYAPTFKEISEALSRIGLSDRVGVRRQFVQPARRAS